MVANNLLPTLITLGLAVLWLRIVNFITSKDLLSADLGRKIIHIGTGPIFVTCWLLFDDIPSARYFAAIVPLLITFQFVLVGLGVIQDQKAVQAMSRTGDRREILKGPLYYGIIFVTLTIIFWFDTPNGIVALMILCGGDGLADILGRRFGKIKIPWNPGKSIVGSIGMFFGGALLSIIILSVFVSTGIFLEPISAFLFPVVIIAGIATFVESLPINEIDNITITLSSIVAGLLFFMH